jgi:hypothetical protein
MKTYGRPFLTWELYGGEWLNSRPGHSLLGEGAGSQSWSGQCGVEKITFPCPAVQPVARRYTD